MAEQPKALFKFFNLPSALAQASSLRGGIPCKVTANLAEKHAYRQLEHGGCNVHIPIQFDDGHEWMIRIRYNHMGRPYEAMRMNIISELATMRALREGGMKVPAVWLPDLSEECELYSEHLFSSRDFEQ